MNTQNESGCLSVVTGAGGFIGSHLVETLLARGDRVRALVHYNALGSRGHLEEVIEKCQGCDRLQVVAGDICDERCVRELVTGADVVFHLAALIGIPYSYRAPRSYVQVNVVGTLNVLEACRDAGVGRVLHTSTSETLGSARYTPQDEGHPLQGQSPYAASKIAADKLAESYYLSFDLPVTVVRPFNTYGPRQSARAVIPTIICQAISPVHEKIVLGSLEPVRDFTFVGDTAEAFAAISDVDLDVVAGKLYHLGVGEGIAIGDIAQKILKVLNCKKEVVVVDLRMRPARSEVIALVSDNTLVKRDAGWSPRVSLCEGIERTAAWIQKHPDLFRPEEYTL